MTSRGRHSATWVHAGTYRAPSVVASVRCAGPAPTRIERDGSTTVCSRERERQPGQRRAAPAARRAGRVRAQRALHRAGDRGGEACDTGVEHVQGAVGAPVEDQVWRVTVALSSARSQPGTPERGRRDEDPRLRSPGRRRAHEGHVLHAREALVGRRRLELAERAHLRRRRQHTLLTSRQPSQLLGSRERAETLEQALDEIDLGLRERRVEPDAPRRDWCRLAASIT